jgi:hypothetical protein
MARAWHSNRIAPTYRTGPRRLSGATRNPPNRPIHPTPSHISPNDRTSRLDARNTAKPSPANRRRSRWAADISITTHTSPIGRVIPNDRASRPVAIT